MPKWGWKHSKGTLGSELTSLESGTCPLWCWWYLVEASLRFQPSSGVRRRGALWAVRSPKDPPHYWRIFNYYLIISLVRRCRSRIHQQSYQFQPMITLTCRSIKVQLGQIIIRYDNYCLPTAQVCGRSESAWPVGGSTFSDGPSALREPLNVWPSPLVIPITHTLSGIA